MSDAMAGHWQLALWTVPLAIYTAILAAWNGGRHPRVVWGAFDRALLAFGLGGFAVFGPIGWVVERHIFHGPRTLSWLTVASAMSLLTLSLSRGDWRRLVIYHVDRATLERALIEVFEGSPGRFVQTLRGYEDPEREYGVLIDFTPRSATAQIEAYGRDPERFIYELSPLLREQFQRVILPRPRKTWLYVAVSLVCLTAPAIGWIAERPGAPNALRPLIERFLGR